MIGYQAEIKDSRHRLSWRKIERVIDFPLTPKPSL